jgi:ribosome-associated heat shock protein Hsp15
MNTHEKETMRLDKWLWCARFYKTRSLATEEIGKGRVTVHGQAVKAARDLRCGDTVALRQGPVARTVVVKGLSGARGPAPVAQQLYEETAESITTREKAAELRRLAPEPAAALQEGRPTKRDRREIDRIRAPASDRTNNWGDRWSASVDE